MHSPDLLDKVGRLPHKPGVYVYRDRLGHIIYVGKARDLRKRVGQYFHPSRQQKADPKTRSLISSICDLEVHVVNSEPEAVLLEGKLIKEYRPRFNIVFRDDKRFLLVRVQTSDPFPRFDFTRLRKEDGARYFGPFPNPMALRKTLRLMTERFGLRTCPPHEPGEKDYRHCHDDVLKNCSAPCIGKISSEDYQRRVTEACEFLEGAAKSVVTDLTAQMQEAAAIMDFERAAKLRDQIHGLKETTRPIKRFVRDVKTPHMAREDLNQLQSALQLNLPPAILECFDISNISTTHKVASMVCFRDGIPDKANYRRYRIVSVEGQDDFASIAEAVRRRYGRVLKESLRLPNLIVVDGGKGQLSAACHELKILGLENIPIIGLAKENEEIYSPGKSTPLVLDRRHAGLKLLQRLRDEAHRFANGYHQILLRRRMTESLLDDCPGISTAKKALLLKHFGSVSRLKKAGPEEISKLRGMGPTLSKTIVNYLNSLK